MTGLTSLFGAETLERREDGQPTLRVILDPWRPAGGYVSNDRLFLTIPPDALPATPLEIEPAQLFSARVRLTGNHVGEVLEVLDAEVGEGDHWIAEVHARWKADGRRDERFGPLAYNTFSRWYAAPVIWNGQPAQLDLEIETEDDLPATLRTAAALWDHEAEWNARVQDYAVEQFLAIRNGLAREQGTPSISAAEFRAMMRLATVGVDRDGNVQFIYDALDLIPGFNDMHIYGSLQEGITGRELL